MIYVYLFVMAVCAVGVVIERQDWGKEPEVPDASAKVLERVETLTKMSEHNFSAIAKSYNDTNEKVDSLSKKLEYLEVKVQNQKPPVVQFPDKVAIDILSAPAVKGSLNLQTPQGKRLRVLHAPGIVRKPATFESVKKQIETLSK